MDWKAGGGRDAPKTKRDHPGTPGAPWGANAARRPRRELETPLRWRTSVEKSPACRERQ
jgi:hypothetical protein